MLANEDVEKPYYGITSGVGPFSKIKINKEDIKQF